MSAATVRQKIEIPYHYTTGPAVGRFLLALKARTILAGVCPECGRASLPPLSTCGRCFKPVTEFREVGPQGTLESFAALPEPVSELPDAALPVVYVLVRLDGAGEARLAHLVRAQGPEALRCGARVEAVWREERRGSILDIAWFRVVAA